MTKGLMRLAAIAASGAAFLVLTGCGGASPDDGYSGPAPEAYDRGGDAPGLMGGAAPTARRGDGSGLLGGPSGDASMAPIPNPADLTKAERRRWYGRKYDHLPEPKGRRAGAPTASGQLLSRRKADGTLQVSMRPIANPEDMTPAERRRVYGYRYAPRAETQAAPRRRFVAAPVAAPAPRPVPARPVVAARPVTAAAPAAKPAAPLKTAPKVAIPAPAAKLTPGQQLGAAVRPEVMKGAVLTVPEGLAKGEAAKVSLSLPATLLDVIKREAAKFGLGKAARKAEVSATLTGAGYEITPNAAQTQTLKAGEAARFDWDVKPGAGDKAPLKATIDGTLTGDRKARTAFSLGTLEQAVATPVAEVKKAAKGFKLPSLSMPRLSLKALALPGKPVVDLPVVGKTASEKVVGAGIALLALLAVLGMARSASAGRARAERRRKFRTMQDYGRVEPEPEAAPAPAHEPSADHSPYVNPMLAAAGGAAAGAAVTHAVHEHQDDHAAEEPVREHHAEPEPAAAADHGHVEPVAHEDHGPAEAPAAHDHHREPEHV